MDVHPFPAVAVVNLALSVEPTFATDHLGDHFKQSFRTSAMLLSRRRLMERETTLHGRRGASRPLSPALAITRERSRPPTPPDMPASTTW